MSLDLSPSQSADSGYLPVGTTQVLISAKAGIAAHAHLPLELDKSAKSYPHQSPAL